MEAGKHRTAQGLLVAALLALACGGDAESPISATGGNGATPAPAGGGKGSGSSSGAPNVGTGIAPSDPAIGSGEPSSPAQPSGPAAPPRELLVVDSGLFQITPPSAVCPEGTRPVDAAYCLQIDKRSGGPRFPCVCEYECSPECGFGEVCAPDGACQCHAALEASAEGCVWRGLTEDDGFDGTASWKLWTNGAPGAASARVNDGKLELALSARCSFAWAGTTARLPPRSWFPEGAALAITYSAGGGAADSSMRASLGGTSHLDLTLASTARDRHCVELQEPAALTTLEFALEANGLCAEAIDLRLSIDEVRLEADPSCG